MREDDRASLQSTSKIKPNTIQPDMTFRPVPEHRFQEAIYARSRIVLVTFRRASEGCAFESA
jgi:hypothetical protein